MSLPLATIHRILDVNLNRAGEALRVIEEFARFDRETAPDTAALKALRHDLNRFAPAAGLTREHRLTAREAQGDVGRPDGTPLQAYETPNDLLAANFSRAFEAFRVLAEYARLLDRPEASVLAEDLRFRAYALEASLLPPRAEKRTPHGR